ncbi:MAG: lysophospholipid acyltransferase family protein [Alphaproteobacteria bacterium]|nr:lysophospholipid acyltransferase family protein [Alphaproteobacteria bacterium]
MFQNKTFRKLWKGFWEPILSLQIFQWVIAILMAIPIWFVYFTSIKKITNIDVFYKYRKKPAIFIFWHGRSMMLSPIICLGGMHAYAVASRHKDGRMMAKLQHLFGLRAIYGSSHKGGVSVLREGLRVLARGDHGICLSPDGPGGPSLRVQDGALYFAKMSGAPIIPVCYSCSKSWLQDRWDRYLVALPFSKITCNIGNPIFVPKKVTPQEFEDIRKNIEDFMVAQMRELDAEFGLKPAEQDLTSVEFKQKKREAAAAKKASKRKKI